MDVNTAPIPRPQPLRTSVYRRVVGMMTSGELLPGQTVTEAGLSKTLGVSRTPVREALLQLEAEGMLQSTPAKGFAVRELSVTEAMELFPILATLEGLALRLAGTRDLAHLHNIDAQLTAAEDPVERWQLDTDFHQVLIDGCPNTSLLAMITRLRITLSRYEIEYMRRAGGWQHLAGSRHAAILDALKHRDLDGATHALADNWQASLDALKTWLPA
ncbi:MAG: GntR family transcriptional regulator [Labedaea sp.]